MFYSQLRPDELEKMAQLFEKEFVPTRPLTAAMRAQERRAKRKRGRPVVGEGAEKVLLTLERGLLREADSYAKKHSKNRSQLVAEALRGVLRRSAARCAG
jgi:hypothetical protein